MDKYDAQISELTKDDKNFKALLRSHWITGYGIFEFVNKDGRCLPNCGCLTMIRIGRGFAFDKDDKIDEAMTKAIMDDDRIPSSHELITQESLFVFAEWQRRLDKELRNG